MNVFDLVDKIDLRVGKGRGLIWWIEIKISDWVVVRIGVDFVFGGL